MKKFKNIPFKLIGSLILIIGLIGIGIFIGKQDVFKSREHSEETQVIKTLTKEKQIVLVNLGISDIYGVEKNLQVFDADIFGTNKHKYMKAEFDMKLGIDGKQVKINKTGTDTYEVKVPKFMFIGHSNTKFKVIVDDGGILSWMTPDIDESEMINKILDSKAQETYIKKYDELLKESTTEFYQTLINSIAPDAKLTITFS
ncbi:hypothetical protein CBF34_09025 [Vagococcus penaei]|uniref:Uncharacterized protein n=1 Tax=Vagococcus penaei TaxID=633807 RepID=A0A1Q2D537_9ENTE|nr:hypothetical protein [Vagococcus penaei]AQP53395.1 hypothetical protein BW732_03515 [Vagococcus penaei]RST99717.1 hypothetical protein CBF34_09025 [Vagococcus penaei]